MGGLKHCRKCGQYIGEKVTCPNCVSSQNNEDITVGHILGCLCFIVIGVIFIIIMFLPDFEEPEQVQVNWQDEDNSGEAYGHCEIWVKERLKSPSTADFPSLFLKDIEDFVKKDGTIYTVESYVDAQNSYGATIRSNFNCVVRQSGKNLWELQFIFIE